MIRVNGAADPTTARRTTMAEPFPLGSRVTIHGSIRKERTHEGRTHYVPAGKPQDWTGPWEDPLRQYAEGIVVGKRTFQTGHTDHGGFDGTTFRADGSVTAYLVAYHLHRKPSLCLPEQLTLKPDPEVEAWSRGFEDGCTWTNAIEKADPDTPEPANPYRKEDR